MYSEKALAQLQENGYGAAEACFEQRSGEGEGNDVLQHLLPPVVAVKAAHDLSADSAEHQAPEFALGRVPSAKRSLFSRIFSFGSSDEDNSAPPTDDPEESFRRHLVRRSEGCACCPQTFEFLRICVHRSSGAIVLLSTLTLAVFLIIYYWKTEVDENISNVQSSSNRREGIGRF
jgi:hypothetical protein